MVADIVDQAAEGKALSDRRAFLGLAEGQGVGAERNRPVDGGDQDRRRPADAGILARAQPVRNQMRGGEHIAQVMTDLGDRGTQRRQMGLLAKRRSEILLHRREFALGGADLVAAIAGLDHAGGAFRGLAEGHHGGGDAAHRQHQKDVKGEIDQTRRQQ